MSQTAREKLGQLTEAFGEQTASTAMDLMEGRKDPEDFPTVQQWIRECWNRPSDSELIMQALNEVLGGYGVEGVTPEGEISPVASYVNTGDSYYTTVIQDIEEDEFVVSSWGDWVEEWERENPRED